MAMYALGGIQAVTGRALKGAGNVVLTPTGIAFKEGLGENFAGG